MGVLDVFFPGRLSPWPRLVVMLIQTAGWWVDGIPISIPQQVTTTSPETVPEVRRSSNIQNQYIYIYYMCAPCRVWLSATKVIWPKYRWTYHTMEHRHSSMIHIIHIIHPDSTYPRRPPRPRLLVQKRLEPGDCRETLRQKRSGRHGIMDWWKILGDSSPGPNCVMPVSHGEKDGNHHSTVWKMKDAIMNVDDVKYMMIYLGMNIWMMYTPTLNISVYVYMLHVRVTCPQHEESNQCETVKHVPHFLPGSA